MIGIDIVDIKRIANLSLRKNFINRVFTESEIEYIESKNQNPNTIAGLFASKEAVAKAFGVGISHDIVFKEIEILHDENGAPYVNTNIERMLDLMKKKSAKEISINITHDGDYAIAVANIQTKKKRRKSTPYIYPGLLSREDNSNKYDFGQVLIIGGKKGMTGSVILSSQAALRSGAGLVYLLVPECIRNIVEAKTMEQIVLSINDDGENEFGNFDEKQLLNAIQDKSVVAIGTGLGTGENAKKIVETVIENFTGPIVIDADAINILADNHDLIHDDLYLTPHAMEFSRLSSYTLNEIEYDRVGRIENFLDRYDVNILLKGNETIVADKDHCQINKTGNSGMATAGSGDVLTGIVAALLARQKSYQMFHLAVMIHGLSGDIAMEKYGKTSLIASDIIECLPKAFGEMDDNWC